MRNDDLPGAADVVIVGAGAAGLFAAVFAGRTHPGRQIVVLDGAKKLGAKILVAGGGRCNVTHDVVTADAYAGGSRNAIRKVLQRFDVEQTRAFFRDYGVELKREETGKLFPTTDSARTVLDALMRAVRDAGATIRHPFRVEHIERRADGFRVVGAWGSLECEKVILATGGRSLPKSGSDGHGYTLAKRLGHTLTTHILPSLVPLTLPASHYICDLSGITVKATLDLVSAAGKRLISFTDSTLCTHFGLSGPSVLDISRYYLAANADQPGAARLTINWLPDETSASFEQRLMAAGRVSVGRLLSADLPERLARALCTSAGVDFATACDQLSREARKTLVQMVTADLLPVTGSRGFTFAEVTAGGVPLSEIRLETMESRLCPGLHLCGEICDVDGRIGGYNFQWAWSSGFVAGSAV